MANLQPLRSYIRQNISHLRATPCLLISSSPPPPSISTAVAGTKSPSSISDLSDEKQQQAHKDQLKFQQLQNDKRIHSFVERNTQSLTLEFNLRSVPCYISSAFPTLQNVNEAVSLAERAGLKKGTGGGNSGDGVVIGIGSGAAMDLAKAVSDTLFDNIAPRSCENDGEVGGSLVLAPCTLGGLWAASSDSPSVLLDTKEEMLLPHLTPSWRDNISPSRRGTVVTLDPTKYLAMPPLYTPFQPVKRSEYSAKPSMAHVAAAALAIVLDIARSLDLAIFQGETTDVNLKQNITNEMKVVASSCASVLELAARESRNNVDERKYEGSNDNQQLAQQYLLGAIPRLSTIVQQSTLLTEERTRTTTTGTIPQKLANALLPQYFPQCHLVTYLACILPGLCDALSSTHKDNAQKGSFREAVSRSIKHNDHWSPSEKKINSLSAWASHVTMEAGVPTMASLAYGTPDVNALVGSLDSYDTLMSSLTKGHNIMASGGHDDHNFMEDVLRRSLHR